MSGRSAPRRYRRRTVHRLLLAEQQVRYAIFRACQETRHHQWRGHAHPSALNNYRPSLRSYAILYTQPPTTMASGSTSSRLPLRRPTPCATSSTRRACQTLRMSAKDIDVDKRRRARHQRRQSSTSRFKTDGDLVWIPEVYLISEEIVRKRMRLSQRLRGLSSSEKEELPYGNSTDDCPSVSSFTKTEME